MPAFLFTDEPPLFSTAQAHVDTQQLPWRPRAGAGASGGHHPAVLTRARRPSFPFPSPCSPPMSFTSSPNSPPPMPLLPIALASASSSLLRFAPATSPRLSLHRTDARSFLLRSRPQRRRAPRRSRQATPVSRSPSRFACKPRINALKLIGSTFAPLPCRSYCDARSSPCSRPRRRSHHGQRIPASFPSRPVSRIASR